MHCTWENLESLLRYGSVRGRFCSALLSSLHQVFGSTRFSFSRSYRRCWWWCWCWCWCGLLLYKLLMMAKPKSKGARQRYVKLPSHRLSNINIFGYWLRLSAYHRPDLEQLFSFSPNYGSSLHDTIRIFTSRTIIILFHFLPLSDKLVGCEYEIAKSFDLNKTFQVTLYFSTTTRHR